MSTPQKQNDRFKDYISVAERIDRFYERFPAGKILTSILEHDRETGFILIRAEAYREQADTLPASTGHAYEIQSDGYVNKSSYIENCETGAVGRALALLGFEVKRGVASREEMEKADRQAAKPANAPTPQTFTDKQAKAEHERLDREIEGALTILGRSEANLNEYVHGKYETDSDWRDQSIQIKREIFTFLNNKINKAAAEVR